MSIEIHPADESRFCDLATMVGPKKNPDGNVCWCLSHRIPAKQNRELHGRERGEYVRRLTHEDVKPGVLAYDGDEVVGWAAVAPRRTLPFARSTTIPHVDDIDVWSIWCVRVRPGHRRQGITGPLIEGAVAYARECGAPAVEGYPVDNAGEKVDLTMAFVGTRRMFERAGFSKAAATTGVSGGFPRVIMRRDLR